MEKDKCPNCGSSSTTIYQANQRNLECTDCGTLFPNPAQEGKSLGINAGEDVVNLSPQSEATQTFAQDVEKK